MSEKATETYIVRSDRTWFGKTRFIDSIEIGFRNDDISIQLKSVSEKIHPFIGLLDSQWNRTSQAKQTGKKKDPQSPEKLTCRCTWNRSEIGLRKADCSIHLQSNWKRVTVKNTDVSVPFKSVWEKQFYRIYEHTRIAWFTMKSNEPSQRKRTGRANHLQSPPLGWSAGVGGGGVLIYGFPY